MTQPLPIPEACALALDAVLENPLDPGAGAESHLRACPACAEARILFLAQEDTPEALAPAGYHDRLPVRILGKLPARPSLRNRMRPAAWAAAAVLLMAVAAGAFWAGRANRTPYVEAAARSLPSESTDIAVPDTPFHNREEDTAQVHSLSPDEMEALLERLNAPEPAPR